MSSQSIVLADNAYGTIGSGLAVSDTALAFTTGHGARFPVVSAGQILSCCILNANNVLEEINITAHASGSDTATIVRGANGTTAKAWSAGDRIEARLSSDVLRRIQQDMQVQTTLSTADGGATYTGTMSPAPLGYVTGMVYALQASTSNSGTTPTIALNSLAAITVKRNGGLAVIAGQMPVNGLYQFDGSNFILLNPTNAKTLDTTQSVTNVSNSNAATDVYTFSVPANTLKTKGGIRLRLFGSFFNNTGGNVNFKVQFKYGGTTFADSGNQPYSPSASSHAIMLEALVCGGGATNLQKTWAQWKNAAAGTQSGSMSTTTDYGISCVNSIAIDSTADQNIVVTVTLDTADANASLTLTHADLEMI